MPSVTFDAQGPAGGGCHASPTSPNTWTHPGGTSPSAVYVGASFDTSGAYSSYTLAATYGGISMGTPLKAQASGSAGTGGTSGFIVVWKLESPPAGSQTVSVTFSGNTLNNLIGGSVSVAGSAGEGAVAVGEAQAVTSGSIAVSGTSTGGLCLAFLATGAGGEVWTAGTQRYLDDTGGTSAAGNTTAATLASAPGTTTLSWTMTSDWYGVIAFEAQPPAGTTTSPAYAAAAADLGGGAGSWLNPGNADGAPDSVYATWTAP